MKEGGVTAMAGWLIPSVLFESCTKNTMSAMNNSSFTQVKVIEGSFSSALPNATSASASACSLLLLNVQSFAASIVQGKST